MPNVYRSLGFIQRSSAYALILLTVACASTEPVEIPEPVIVEEAPPQGPVFEYVGLVGGGLVGPSGQYRPGSLDSIVERFPSSQGNSTLVAAVSGDSTLLFLDNGARITRVHATQGKAVYTVSWSPNGSDAAFGYYIPDGEASVGRVRMGRGDVLLWRQGSVARVGCSASRAVLAWMPDGQLLVRNTDNLYVVRRDGCATVATVDARRMHALTVSPDAAHLAFVHRELEYDRASRSYVADSTFRLTDLDGGNPKTIVSFRYNPRRLAWSPDGTELAFDVEAPDMAATRAISIFDVASGRTAFLHPPREGSSEFAAVWSPDGDRIAYLKGDPGQSPAVWIRSFSASFPEAVPETQGAEVIGWVDNRALVLSFPDGAFGIHDLPTGRTQRSADRASFVSARRAR